MDGYNRQVHLSKKTTQFSVTLSRKPSGPDTSYMPTYTRNTKDGDGIEIRSTDLRHNMVQIFHTMVLRTDRELKGAQGRHKK